MGRNDAIFRKPAPAGNFCRLVAGMFCLTASAGIANAGEIYKSFGPDGKVIYSDHLEPSMSQSTVVQLQDQRLPPSSLHFCWTNCFALILEDGVYRRTDGADETWTIETFTANAVVLHRHDAPGSWNGNSPDVVYAGHVANDRLIDVTVNGKPVSGVDASWGTALNTLPGSNAERDAAAPENENGTALPVSSVSTVSSDAEPPPLQEEDQPALSQDGLLWTPGYWSWRDHRYFWVRGAWMRPPQAGFLWTPGYWAFNGARYLFHPGHWGATVGFYGGVNYGHGYVGNGYVGGHWVGNSFVYNSGVNRVDPAVAHHTFTESVPESRPRSVLSYTAERASAGSAYAASQRPPPARDLDRPATRNIGDRINETTSMSMKADRPSPTAKAPASSSAVKVNHVSPSRAAPVKP